MKHNKRKQLQVIFFTVRNTAAMNILILCLVGMHPLPNLTESTIWIEKIYFGGVPRHHK
jgi:hypothetical protein